MKDLIERFSQPERMRMMDLIEPDDITYDEKDLRHDFSLYEEEKTRKNELNSIIRSRFGDYSSLRHINDHIIESKRYKYYIGFLKKDHVVFRDGKHRITKKVNIDPTISIYQTIPYNNKTPNT